VSYKVHFNHVGTSVDGFVEDDVVHCNPMRRGAALRGQILVSASSGASEDWCEAAPSSGDAVDLFDSPAKKNLQCPAVHSRSATLAQVFHKRPRTRSIRTHLTRVLCGVTAMAIACLADRTASAQTTTPGEIHFVFLNTGTSLPSFGEAALVGDRVVFNLSIAGPGGRRALQLVSLPAAVVDTERTTRYMETMRAERYGATRGEADYAVMTAEAARDLDRLSRLPDRAQQLVLAEEMRRRLLAWPRHHYGYRATDCFELAGLVGDLINEIRRGRGETTFMLDLAVDVYEPGREPLRPTPGPRESVELALRAAEAADIGEERIAVLRAAAAVPLENRDLKQLVSRRLADEQRVGRAYDALSAEFRQRAAAAVDRGDVDAIERLGRELPARDKRLGFRRPTEMRHLVAELRAALEAVRARQAFLIREAAVRMSLRYYERRIRPVLSALAGLTAVLRHIRDVGGREFERTVSAESRFAELLSELDRVAPPGDAAGVHATLVGALRMAREACARRRMADVTNGVQLSLEAASAAAGALLLAEQVQMELGKR
jgi:hypothetical protein